MPEYGSDLSVPSMIFDEYGEVKALPANPVSPARPASPVRPANPAQDEMSVQSAIFDEYGEVKAIPATRTPPARQVRQNPVQPPQARPIPASYQASPVPAQTQVRSAPAQPQLRLTPVQPPAGRLPLQSQGRSALAQPQVRTNPVPVVAPAVRVNQPLVTKAPDRKMGVWVWVALVAVPLLLVGLIVGLILANNPGKPGTAQVQSGTGSFPSIFPLDIFSRVMVVNNELDTLYTQAKTALTNRQFLEAAASSLSERALF